MKATSKKVQETVATTNTTNNTTNITPTTNNNQEGIGTMKETPTTKTMSTKKATLKSDKKGNRTMNKPELKALTTEQKAELDKLSRQILDNLSKNYELGKALREVKKLLAGTTENFEPYCKEHFALAHAQVSRLMHYADVRDNLGLLDQNVYLSENTLRSMYKFSADAQKKIWEKALQLADGKDIPSAANVIEACKAFSPVKPRKTSAPSKQFFCRTLQTQVNLEKENVVDVVKKADSVTAIKSVIEAIVKRVEVNEADRQAICEIIREKAVEEAMTLLTAAAKKSTAKKEKAAA